MVVFEAVAKLNLKNGMIKQCKVCPQTMVQEIYQSAHIMTKTK